MTFDTLWSNIVICMHLESTQFAFTATFFNRFESSEGTVKVQWRKSKRYNDLAASRGELIEVCIEAVFEPMVQGTK